MPGLLPLLLLPAAVLGADLYRAQPPNCTTLVTKESNRHQDTAPAGYNYDELFV